MLTLNERKKLHRDFWEGKLEKPLLGVFLPCDTGYSGIDIDLSCDDVVEKNKRSVEFFKTSPDQRIPRCNVNFGPVFPVAVSGGKMEWDKHTSWAESDAASIDAVKPLVFNPDHPLWINYVEKFNALGAADFAETLLAPEGLLGPFDLIAALTGSELLCIECLMNPEKVAELAGAATDFWLEFYDINLDLLPESDGIATLFGMYCPGRGALWTEDFIALCGPEIYRDLVLPCDTRIAEALDTCYMHVHSGGIKCLEHILKIPTLSGVEISNDPNGPCLEVILEWASEAYRNGKSVMLSNWERHSIRKDVELILSRIDPSRTIVTLDAKDMTEARLWQQMFGG